MRRSLSILAVLAMIILPATATSATSDVQEGPPINFWAPLTGADEVPPLDTAGAGVFGASVNDAETALSLMVATFNLEDVVAGHVHCAPVGVNGPVGVTLYGQDPVTQDGRLVQLTVTAPDDGNECGWMDLDDVLAAMRSGDAYVNFHTTANPGGEIRGQVEGFARPDPGSGTFNDDDGNVHEGNIEAIAAPGITQGCNPPDNDEYCPDDDITRGQMAAFLRRTFNLGAVADDFFGDDDDSIFHDDINVIASVGITQGCNPPENDEFCPDETVTRGEMASFLVRALALTEGAGDDLFTDDDGSVHEDDIDALGTSGITLGCNPPTNDQYCPDDPLSRAEMGSFFARFLEFRALTPGTGGPY